MKEANNDIEQLTRELLSKSLLQPASSSFEDKLMDKILLAPSPAKRKANGDITRKAWFFWILTVVLFLTSLMIVATFSKGYYSETSDILRLIFTYVLYGGMMLFVPLVLYYFDALIQLKYLKNSSKMNAI